MPLNPCSKKDIDLFSSGLPFLNISGKLELQQQKIIYIFNNVKEETRFCETFGIIPETVSNAALKLPDSFEEDLKKLCEVKEYCKRIHLPSLKKVVFHIFNYKSDTESESDSDSEEKEERKVQILFSSSSEKETEEIKDAIKQELVSKGLAKDLSAKDLYEWCIDDKQCQKMRETLVALVEKAEITAKKTKLAVGWTLFTTSTLLAIGLTIAGSLLLSTGLGLIVGVPLMLGGIAIGCVAAGAALKIVNLTCPPKVEVTPDGSLSRAESTNNRGTNTADVTLALSRSYSIEVGGLFAEAEEQLPISSGVAIASYSRRKSLQKLPGSGYWAWRTRASVASSKRNVSSLTKTI